MATTIKRINTHQSAPPLHKYCTHCGQVLEDVPIRTRYDGEYGTKIQECIWGCANKNCGNSPNFELNDGW